MRISAKGEYGILALVDLALHPEEAAVQAYQIAERQRIPKQYLDQLMLTLRKAGLVASSRGRQGGYRLARPAVSITLMDAVVALEGPVQNVNYKSSGRSRPGVRSILKHVWDELAEQAAATLRDTTIEDLCNEYQRTSAAITYEI